MFQRKKHRGEVNGHDSGDCFERRLDAEFVRPERDSAPVRIPNPKQHGASAWRRGLFSN